MGRCEIAPSYDAQILKPLSLRGRLCARFVNKKRIAKEWLYFLGFFFFGLLVVPLLLFVFLVSSMKLSKVYSDFFSELGGGHDALIVWLFVLGPYLLFQLARSIIWAWKTARKS